MRQLKKPSVFTRSKTRFDACRAAYAAHPRKSPRKGGTARIDITEKPKKSHGIMMLALSVYIVGFCAAAFMVSQPGTEGREAAILGTMIFVPIAAALGLGGADQLYRRIHLAIAGDTLSYDCRALFRPKSFTEPLSAYACVLPESSLSGSKDEPMRMAFHARLVHRDNDTMNCVLLVGELDELQVHTDRGSERTLFENFARSVNLPLATEAVDGTVTIRHPDELDLSVEEYAKTSGIHDEPGPERPFPTHRYRVTSGPDGVSAVRGYPLYLIPFAAFVAGAVASKVLLTANGIRQPIPLVLGFFSLFMLAFALIRSHLELRADTVTASYTLAGIRILHQSIPLREVEELTVARDPRYRRHVLRIASDCTSISWGSGDSDEEIAWFKDAVLRAIRASAPAAKQ
jgi:uncharacterized membrane protein YoaK (UPF0700 family)